MKWLRSVVHDPNGTLRPDNGKWCMKCDQAIWDMHLEHFVCHRCLETITEDELEQLFKINDGNPRYEPPNYDPDTGIFYPPIPVDQQPVRKEM